MFFSRPVCFSYFHFLRLLLIGSCLSVKTNEISGRALGGGICISMMSDTWWSGYLKTMLLPVWKRTFVREPLWENLCRENFVREFCIENFCLFREREKTVCVFYLLLRCSHVCSRSLIWLCPKPFHLWMLRSTKEKGIGKMSRDIHCTHVVNLFVLKH